MWPSPKEVHGIDYYVSLLQETQREPCVIKWLFWIMASKCQSAGT